MASSSRLAPYEKGQIKASVSTAGRRGKFSKHIVVHSNDPKTPRIMLTVVTTVIAPKTKQRQRSRPIKITPESIQRPAVNPPQKPESH